MTTSAVKFDDLRARILLLDATSDQGFEGLIGAVLSDQTGSAFDLAKSGSQRGKDGQSAYDTGAVRFECKLYTGPVPRTEALSKIGEIGADNNSNVELFVIASTSIVRTQDREAVEAIGAKLGIATFIVDWPSVGIPNLAVLLAMSPDVASIFIAQGLGCPASDVRVELDEVAADPHFADRARELRNAIDMPSASPAFARRRNASFLRSAFENSRKARTVFAQVLAPADPTTPGLMPRQGLKDKLGPLAFGPPIDTTVFILGGDGNGKSWIFAQSWLEQDDPPLTVIIMPEDFPGAVTPVGLQELLIGKLLTQTGDIDTLETRMRWRRFFQMWRQTKSTEKPRLVLFLDGINQRESLDWPRIIIGLSGLLAELGGRLIVSSRTAFFNARIKVKLLDPYEFVEVGQWSNPELQELLNPFNELVDSLEAAVANILRNPRIFAIAARLHRSGVIRDFRELSVSRLLLEHLRSGAAPEPMTEAEFIASLRSYADAIVQRLVNQQHDDLKIFSRPVRGLAEDRSISDQMAVIADGNFFEPVKGDSTLFRLKDESSPLALGLSVLSTAQRAQRNQLNISGALSKVLDPISAVDDMADVLLSALIAAVLLDDNAEEIVAALAVAYASLQNLDQTRFAEFKALVLRLPQPFLLALEDAVLSDGSVANLSWLVDSVMELRREPACRAAIETSCQRWLSMYSLDARRRLLTNDPVGSAEYTQALAEKQQRLDEVTGALSSVESDLLDEMFDEPRGDYLDLGKLSFQLLAGGPLAGFGQAFRNWAFATALNGGFQDGHDQFEDLIQLNLVDWSDTQRAILEAAERLLASDVSTTGQWALVYLLRATGAAADAAQAETIAEDLTRDREKMTGWRSIERCCDTDPCDPNSEEPGNIGATAEQSEALDVSKLRGSRNYTMEDHSFDEAMTGLARFSPDVAIQTMRRFADDVLTRSADQGRIAMFFLDNQTAALDDAYGPKLVDWAHSAAADAIANGDAHNETFMASQFALVTAFPHLSGDRQLAALSDLAHSPTLLLPLCYAMTPCDPTVLESAIEAAYAGDDAMQQFRLLTFALYSRSTLSDRVRALVGEFVTSPDNLVRLAALGVAANRVDAALDGVVANSGWTAASLDRQKASFEITYGSIILVRAAKSQLISVKDCLERIGFRSYGILLREFGATIAATIADRLDAALKKAAGFVVTQAIPDIEFRSHLDTQPDTYNLEERQGEARSLEEQMDKMSESSDAFYERHERYSAAFKAFERDLTQAGANLIIEMATSEFLGDLFAILPDRLHQWKAWLLELDTPALNRVHNVALVIAQVTAAGDADGAVALFKRLQDSEPFVKVVVGLAKAPLSSIAIWAAADSDPIKSLSFSQLDKAPNDDALATQVLCAIRAKKQHLLKEYVVDRRCRSEPAHKARALMVAGFSEGEDWAVETLNTHKSDRGMLGEAFEEAKYALDRFQWSKTWGRKMREANSQTDLWRYSILLSKIVDGRFLIPLELGHSNSPLLVRYGSTFDDPIRRRIEKWKKRREGRLFGTAAPSSQFLPP